MSMVLKLFLVKDPQNVYMAVINLTSLVCSFFPSTPNLCLRQSTSSQCLAGRSAIFGLSSQNMDVRVQLVNIKKEKKGFYHTKIWRTSCSISEDPLGVPDPMLKIPVL